MTDALAVAIRSAWEAGCPVAGGDVETLAGFADRRMRSFDRRAKKSSGRMARIDDLGKGLAQHFGHPTSWSSPVKEDLRYLATELFDAAAAARSSFGDSTPSGANDHAERLHGSG